MGNDGGSIPDRRDLVRSKPKAEQADRANQTRARWSYCALSKRPLQEPIVSCPLGKLYNKDAILEYLLDKSAYGDGEEICGHIRSLKDVKTLKLAPNAARSPDASAQRAPFICPLTFKEMNGAQPFVYLASCGCVFSLAGLKAVTGGASSKDREGKLEEAEKEKEEQKEGEGAEQLDVCPQCGAKYAKESDVVPLNPPPEEEEKLRVAMERRRAAEPTKKGKKRKAAAEGDVDRPVKKAGTLKEKKSPTINPNASTASRAVAESLAAEEAKRKNGMSDAVKSLYAPKDGVQKKQTFMTMGTFTRYA